MMHNKVMVFNHPLSTHARSCWQELGYLLVYITGRPDMQKDHVLSFLGAHGFPLGLVSCADSISTDSHHKTLYLARLIKEVREENFKMQASL